MPYLIQKVTLQGEPEVGKFYSDNDGDVFVFLGSGIDPWLEFKSYGAFRRPADYPNEPLTELTTDAIEGAVTRKIEDR